MPHYSTIFLDYQVGWCKDFRRTPSSPPPSEPRRLVALATPSSSPQQGTTNCECKRWLYHLYPCIFDIPVVRMNMNGHEWTLYIIGCEHMYGSIRTPSTTVFHGCTVLHLCLTGQWLHFAKNIWSLVAGLMTFGFSPKTLRWQRPHNCSFRPPHIW